MTGRDREQAWRATDAVLNLLTVRVSTGEIHDLIAELPAELHPALESGERVSRAATPMSADQFVARAVFAALRDVISSKEFADLAAQGTPKARS